MRRPEESRSPRGSPRPGRTPAPPDAVIDPRLADVLRLQGAAGNHATGRVLARDPWGVTPVGGAPAGGRDPWGVAPVPGTSPPAEDPWSPPTSGQPDVQVDDPGSGRSYLPQSPDFQVDDPEAGGPERPDLLQVELSEVEIRPGGQARGEPRSLGGLWVGDLLTWTARYQSSAPPVVDATAPEGWDVGYQEGPGEVTYTATPTRAGASEVWLYMRVGGESWQRRIETRAVIDLVDFGLACTEALAIVIERYGAAAESASNAALAYKKAYQHQAAALGRVARARAMTRELLFSAALATAGGAAGGAVAGPLGSYLGGLVANAVVKGALTDAGKDLTKFSVRAVEKLTGSPSGRRDAILQVQVDDPFSFLAWFSAELGGEQGRLAGLLRETIAAARRARNEGQLTSIDEDPTGIVEGDAVLAQAADGMPDKWTAYLRDLWGGWLRTYSYEIVEEQTTHPGGGQTNLTIASELYGRLRAELDAAAEACGESAEAWITEFALPLRERLRIEARKQAEERGIDFHDPYAGSPR